MTRPLLFGALVSLATACADGEDLAPFETCGTAEDEDGDGRVDEGCPCVASECRDAGSGADAGIADADGPADAGGCRAVPETVQPAIGADVLGLAWHGDGYAAAWRTTEGAQLVWLDREGARLAWDGGIDVSGDTALRASGETALGLAWPSGGRVFFTATAPGTALLAEARDVSVSAGTRSVALATAGSDWAFAFETRDGEGIPSAIFFAVSRAGAFPRPVMIALDPQLRQLHLVELPGGGHVVLWERGGGGILSQALDGRATTIGMTRSWSERGELPAVAVSGDRLAVAWWQDEPDGERTLRLAVVPAGEEPLPGEGRVAHRSPAALRRAGAGVELAGDGEGGFALAWVDDEATLRLARIGSDGGTEAEMALDTLADPETRPRAVFDGERYSVLYTGGAGRHARLVRACP